MKDFQALPWLAVGGAIALTFARWDVIYGYSVDLGLHFALANAFYEQLSRAQGGRARRHDSLSTRRTLARCGLVHFHGVAARVDERPDANCNVCGVHRRRVATSRR